MKMQNRKGSTLVMTLMIFSVLMILGTVTLNLAVNENKQSLNHQYKTQAYYIARSGVVAVEAMIDKMNKDENKLGELLEYLDDPSEMLESDINGLIFSNGILKSVLIGYQEDILKIKATGSVNGVEQDVIREIVVEKSSNSKGINKVITLTKTLSALGNITIKGGTINGDFGANKSIKIDGWPTINSGSNAYIKDANNFTKTNNDMAPKLNVIGGQPEIKYSNPVLSAAPINNSNQDDNFDISGGETNPTAGISSSKYFNKFSIDSNQMFIFDTTNGDIQLIVNNFEIKQGRIDIIGNGKVKIIVLDKFYLKGSLNGSGDHDKLDLFYYGENTFTWNNNGSSIAGSLYVKQADIELNSGYLIGKIISGGEDVTIANAGPKYNVAIYAPSAELNINGGTLRGAFVGKNINIPNNGTNISYDSKHAENIEIPVENTGISESIKLENRYFKYE